MAAGGVAAGVDDCGVNLAREVRDGEQILLGEACGEQSADTRGLVSLNSATVEEFDSLPGIGPTLAQRIVSWREQNGGFASLDQLNDVTGIGDKLFAGISEFVTL
jgi:competence protein ComEA